MVKRTLILGNGSCARTLAENLLEQHVEVILATTGSFPEFPLSDETGKRETAVELLPQTQVVGCEGTVGNFTVHMEKTGRGISRQVASIVIAEENYRKPNFPLYGLSSTPFVLSLSQAEKSVEASENREAFPLKGDKIVFLTGLVEESNPLIAEQIMEMALRLQTEFRKKTYILTKNLKVGGDGLEALYRQTKQAGVVYVKFASTLPEIHQSGDGRVAVKFFDEITRQPFSLTPAVTIVDETILPSENLSALAKVFRLDMDSDGFAQSDNVHRVRVSTNRKGILSAGPAREIQSPGSHIEDAMNALLSLHHLFEEGKEADVNKAEISPGGCVRCLTCYRLCPYRAITLDTKPVVSPEACEGCGICAAECPRGIIHIKELSSQDISSRTSKTGGREGVDPPPFIVAFCCGRSAARAWRAASESQTSLPRGLKVVEVPCAGSISVDHIFTALKNGADGVMVLTCHEGNCHSERGNIYARQRMNEVCSIFPALGFEKERLVVNTVASNMNTEFAKQVNAFEKQIQDLGPSRLKAVNN